MVYELERVCNGFLCSMSVTYDIYMSHTVILFGEVPTQIGSTVFVYNKIEPFI